jgi:hypothetical protein
MVRQYRITAAVVLTLALTANLVPTASADPPPLAQADAAIAASHRSALGQRSPDEQTATSAPTSGPCSEVCSGGAGSYGSPPAVVRVVAHSDGFGWRDGGIGAAACLLVVGSGFAASRAATKSRRRRTGEQRAIATG